MYDVQRIGLCSDCEKYLPRDEVRWGDGPAELIANLERGV